MPGGVLGMVWGGGRYLIVVTLSILVRGINVKPLMARFWKNRKPLPGP